jgi:hypothetical protein
VAAVIKQMLIHQFAMPPTLRQTLVEISPETMITAFLGIKKNLILNKKRKMMKSAKLRKVKKM